MTADSKTWAIEILSEAAEVLDEEIRTLEADRARLTDALGDERMEVLVALFGGQLDRDEEVEVRALLGYGERKLISTWARLAHLKVLRREVARGTMRYINGKESFR
ncbi:hypothetical protein CJ010_10815 [Azoarcus sp. DD4]|uniref:hypothetical protein n=1 Tax=Azoarcus sp. DD4 TaxID=2027405 RepID=UPI001126B87F|nr:hypothetical protein [Azoarcus sp. DD4]QDF96982.1 hypothetical protein CJ010_10815 [Azoarcus sp. DD4]